MSTDVTRIKGFPCYFVTRKGEVWSERYGRNERLKRVPRLLRQHKTNDGYWAVTLSGGNLRTKKFRVHRLLATAFIPNPHDLPQIDHINGNRADNRIENLRWVTQQQNMDYARARIGNWCSAAAVSARNALPPVESTCLTSGSVRWHKSAHAWALGAGNHRMAANVCTAIKSGAPAYGHTWRRMSQEEYEKRIKGERIHVRGKGFVMPSPFSCFLQDVVAS